MAYDPMTLGAFESMLPNGVEVHSDGEIALADHWALSKKLVTDVDLDWALQRLKAATGGIGDVKVLVVYDDRCIRVHTCLAHAVDAGLNLRKSAEERAVS